MTTPDVTVLRRCEAVEITLDGPVQCAEPGHPWEVPSGETYVICADHRVMFDPTFGGLK